MRIPKRLVSIAAVVLTLVGTHRAFAQPGTIEEVFVQGLSRMQEEAFLHLLQLDAGDPYDEDAIRARFRDLWRRGLFEDLVFEVEDAPGGGKALIVKVKERPVLTSVTYEDNPVATRTAIEDRLKERGVELRLGQPLDMGEVFFAESAIRDLLGEKGFLDAEVDSEVRRVTDTTRAVHYSITPGGKTRIADIEFRGNEVFTDRQLKKSLELTQERRWWWPWSGKNLYHPVKWDQDATNIREAYQNRGYLDVEVRPPVVEVRRGDEGDAEQPPRPEPDAGTEPEEPEPDPTAADAAEAELTPKERRKLEKRREKEEQRARKREREEKKVKRTVALTVPIVEGPRYTLGAVEFTGNEVFPDEALRAQLPLREGAVLRNDALEFGVDRITQLYQDRGHLYASVVRRLDRREGEDVADVQVTIEEDKPYYVGRIEFSGNTSTRDNVLRREVLLTEGDLFRRSLLDYSQRKLNQLGYWQIQEEPVLEPIEGESRVDVTFFGEEQGRNEIQVGGGYSGFDGAFFNGVYSTRNFLGRGQILSTAIQVGGRSNRYQISFYEPWFLNRPYGLGFSVFRRDIDYGASLESTSTGFGVRLGRRLGRFSNLEAGYNWQSVEQTTLLASTTGSFTTNVSEYDISSVTPVFAFSTVNNPYRPSAGRSLSVSFEVAGGPLGGTTSFLKPVVSYTHYRRAFGRSFVALHAQGGVVRAWQGGSDEFTGGSVNGIPQFERFWLGGDTLGPRVFETRTITPLRYVELADNQIVRVLGDPRYQSIEDLATSGGVPVLIQVGGDRYYLLQTEYVFPLNEQVEVAAFLDAGNALFEDQSLDFSTARVSAGVEVRFHLPIFPVPLRLIYGIPVREVEGDRTSNFTFSIGRSF